MLLFVVRGLVVLGFRRADALSSEIAQLELEIQRLSARLDSAPSRPKLGPTVLPQHAAVAPPTEPVATPAATVAASHEPIFENRFHLAPEPHELTSTMAEETKPRRER